MAREFLLLNAFGKDQPGMVSAVTHLLFEHGANLEDTSMTRLGGEFAMMLVVSLSNPKVKRKLIKALSSVGRKLKMTLFYKEIDSSLAHAAKRIEPTHLISVYGTDRPGIVYRVTQTLANRKINITDLNTKISKSAKNPFYVMLLEVQLPSKADVQELSNQLKRLGALLHVDITLQDIAPVSL